MVCSRSGSSYGLTKYNQSVDNHRRETDLTVYLQQLRFGTLAKKLSCMCDCQVWFDERCIPKLALSLAKRQGIRTLALCCLIENDLHTSHYQLSEQKEYDRKSHEMVYLNNAQITWNFLVCRATSNDYKKQRLNISSWIFLFKLR